MRIVMHIKQRIVNVYHNSRNEVMMKLQDWLKKAIILGSVFFLAALIVKPVGVSTQFSVLSGVIHSTLDPNVITKDSESESGYQSSNAYYNKSEGKLAKAIKNPINYDFVFVLSIPLGAAIGYAFLNRKKESSKENKSDNDIKSNNDINSNTDIKSNKNKYQEKGEKTACTAGIEGGKRSRIRTYLPSFIGGFLLLYGARMADGCTSGHMMSGMMQGSVSGYLFAAAVFAMAIPTAIIIGNRNKGGKR